MDFFHVKLPENTIYAKIITARAAVFDLLGIKGQGQKLFWLEMDFFHVKLPDKTIYSLGINARVAVFHLGLRGVKSWGLFFWN